MAGARECGCHHIGSSPDVVPYRPKDMRIIATALALLLGTGAVPLLHAQAGASRPDSAQMAAIMARAQQSAKPARFALEHSAELGLKPEQASALEDLARAQTDSEAVRFDRSVAAMSGMQPSAATLAMMSWTGPVDERAIRDEVCAQAQRNVELTLSIIRDRRAVGALLTPAQAAMMNRLQAGDMMKILRRP